MNYIRQLNAFWKWRELHELPHAEADLYLALLSIFNDFFWRDNLPIPAKTPISKAELCDKSQLRKVRKGLIDKGLITYTEGKQGQAGIYNIVKLYTDDIKNTSENTSDVQENDTDLTQEIHDLYPVFDTIEKQNTETETETNIHTSAPAPKDAAAEEICNLYNGICKSLPQVTKLTVKRKAAVIARLKVYSRKQIEEAFQKAEASDFLKGAKGEWKANFDWFFKNDGNILKVIEGNYDNGKDPGNYNGFDPFFDPFSDTPTADVNDIERQFMKKYENGGVANA